MENENSDDDTGNGKTSAFYGTPFKPATMENGGSDDDTGKIFFNAD